MNNMTTPADVSVTDVTGTELTMLTSMRFNAALGAVELRALVDEPLPEVLRGPLRVAVDDFVDHLISFDRVTRWPVEFDFASKTVTEVVILHGARFTKP